MKLTNQLTDTSVLEELGQRLARIRLARNLTQSDLAKQAGLGLRTVQRLESGAAATQLSGFIRVCRILGLLEKLDALIPEPQPSPIDQMKLQGKARRRASSRKSEVSESSKWTWGESL